MGVPPADIEITEDLVRALLRAELPALADRPLRLAASGWDNEMWRLGDDLAVRLPRRELGGELIEVERVRLPELAARLPVAVPAPVHVGAPTSGFPWTWLVVPWFPGTTVDRDGALGASGAATLGGALAALHVPAPSDAPHNPGRSIALRDRPRSPAEILGRADPRLDALWSAALGAPEATVRCWIHGDLHVRNVISARGELAAIIDWGDLCGGDPAVDLGARWTVLEDDTRAAFDAAHGPIDAALDARSRGWAAVFCAIVIDAHREDDRAWATRAEESLERLVAAPGV